MSQLKKILENFEDETFVIMDGFDDAVIGFDQGEMRLIYSVPDCIDCLVREGMNEDDAIDHFEYNVRRSIPYVENAPILMDYYE